MMHAPAEHQSGLANQPVGKAVSADWEGGGKTGRSWPMAEKAGEGPGRGPSSVLCNLDQAAAGPCPSRALEIGAIGKAAKKTGKAARNTRKASRQRPGRLREKTGKASRKSNDPSKD